MSRMWGVRGAPRLLDRRIAGCYQHRSFIHIACASSVQQARARLFRAPAPATPLPLAFRFKAVSPLAQPSAFRQRAQLLREGVLSAHPAHCAAHPLPLRPSLAPETLGGASLRPCGHAGERTHHACSRAREPRGRRAPLRGHATPLRSGAAAGVPRGARWVSAAPAAQAAASAAPFQPAHPIRDGYQVWRGAALRKPWPRSRALPWCSHSQRRGRAADPRHAGGRAGDDDVHHQLADGRGPAGAVQRRFPGRLLLRQGHGQQRGLVGGVPGGLHVLLGPSQLQRCVTARSVGLRTRTPAARPVCSRLTRRPDRYATHDYWMYAPIRYGCCVVASLR